MTRLRATIRDWSGRLFVVSLAAVCTAVALAGNGGWAWLRYERAGVHSLELWRLLTGNFTHLGWSHLAWNLAALTLLAALFDGLMSAGAWGVATLVSGGFTTVGLYVFSPEVDWYVGLSGLLHGVWIFGAIRLIPRHRTVAYVLIAGVIFKVAWEQLAGPMPWSATASGGTVIVDAHLYGLAGGFAAIPIARMISRRAAASL